MIFIQAKNGDWINSDHVVRFTDAGASGWHLEDRDGNTLGVTEHDPKDVGDTILPAAAGTMATVLEWDTGEDGEEGKFTRFRYPIIGWKLLRSVRGHLFVEPIVPESMLNDEAVILLETPSGFVELGTCEYETIEKAIDEATRRRKLTLDLKAAKK
jgi:hypothetical protein